jgi:hypothetical protein
VPKAVWMEMINTSVGAATFNHLAEPGIGQWTFPTQPERRRPIGKWVPAPGFENSACGGDCEKSGVLHEVRICGPTIVGCRFCHKSVCDGQSMPGRHLFFSWHSHRRGREPRSKATTRPLSHDSPVGYLRSASAVLIPYGTARPRPPLPSTRAICSGMSGWIFDPGV